ncbi:MAG: tryptophan--tRNA ligase, partial [Thermoplasmata archaeon]
TVRRKVLSAKTGGKVSLEEQRKYGGEPEKCMVYELFLYHLIEDDGELLDIYNRCREGELMCGDCKKRAVQLLNEILQEIRERRGDKEEIKRMIRN